MIAVMIEAMVNCPQQHEKVELSACGQCIYHRGINNNHVNGSMVECNYT